MHRTIQLSTNNFGPRWISSHANVAQACSIVLSAHQVILPPRVSQEWSPGTPWGGFDPSHHPPLLFWAPPGTTPTTLQRVVDKTVFFSESGSWDNMVNLSTKSFPGDQFWLARERLGFMPRKTLRRRFCLKGRSGRASCGQNDRPQNSKRSSSILNIQQ